jgi:hypothetical protein
MISEIIPGIFLVLVLLFLFYQYLKWADTWNGQMQLYKALPVSVDPTTTAYLQQYGWALPSMVISDTYKYTNFWLTYYLVSHGINILNLESS